MILSYEQEVKKFYPDAKLDYIERYDCYIVSMPTMRLNDDAMDEYEAWENAYYNLKQQGKI